MEHRWKSTSDADLKKLAEGGAAQAQYGYALREATLAAQERNRAARWSFAAVANGQNLTAEEQRASHAKWDSAPETELRQAAESGERGAQWFLGNLETERAARRAWGAFEWAQRAAQQAVPCAEFDMGIQYLGVSGYRYVDPDVTKGVNWLKLSADHGFEPAGHKLAQLYLEGELVPPDLEKGIEYLRRAADLGCFRARYELAQHYAHGDGEPRDSAEQPIALLQKAAHAGFVPAQVALAERYRSGLGVHKDFIRAIQLYQLAAHGGLEAGQELPVFTSDSPFNPPVLGAGEEEPAAPANEALELVTASLEPKQPLDGQSYRFAAVLGLYRKATERVEVGAMKTLGDLYLRGEDVPDDPVQALAWYDLASARGSDPAATASKELKLRLGPVDSEQGAKRQMELLKLLRTVR